MPKMKCPVCGTRHLKYPLACVAEVENRYVHIVIIGVASGRPTSREEKIARAKKHFNPESVDETMRLKDQMDEYLKQFKGEKNDDGHKTR